MKHSRETLIRQLCENRSDFVHNHKKYLNLLGVTVVQIDLEAILRLPIYLGLLTKPKQIHKAYKIEKRKVILLTKDTHNVYE
jgi:hypothetical protein